MTTTKTTELDRTKAMKSMQSMPDIWDNAPFTTSRKAVLGALSCWAIRQSPYLVPDNLTEAVTEFDVGFDTAGEEFFSTSCDQLMAQVMDTIKLCPMIEAWNRPKHGNHQMVFVSRYERPVPDHDFIALDALARNVAHTITVLEKYDLLHQ